MRPNDIISSVCVFAAAASAWPSAWHPFEALKREVAPLLPRQDDSSTTSKFDLSYSGTQGNTATTQTSTEASGTGSDSEATTGSKSGKTTAKATTTGGSTGSGQNSKATSSKTFAATNPAGGVQMLTPAVLQATSYYKIKDEVTFAWNYTSLLQTPSAVDILASCSSNSAMYTLAMNASITGPTQAFTWDTGKFQASATTSLLTGMYTLIIHDAAKEVTALPQPGYLDTYEQFVFGMYTPQAYTPMADFICATCNGAMSSIERQTMGFLFGMVGLTVLSFGWFAGVAGLW